MTWKPRRRRGRASQRNADRDGGERVLDRRGEVARGGVIDLLAKADNAEIDAVGFGLQRVGDTSEPFQTSRGWMVLRLVELEEAKLFSFEEAQGSIEGTLKNEANDKRLKELLEKWKEEFGVVIHDDNFKKVKVTERSATEPLKPAAASS